MLNDTGAGPNPGCQAASSVVKDRWIPLIGATELKSLPVGYGAGAFAGVPGASLRSTVHRWLRFPQWREASGRLDYAAWKTAAKQSVQADVHFCELLDWADRVVVNGEGSIHHNSPRALALMAQCRTAAQKGVPVQLINCTIQSMDNRLLNNVLPRLEYLHVREQWTARSLTRAGHQCRPQVSVDLAAAGQFSTSTGVSLPEGVDPRRACLLSPGVLASPRVANSQIRVLKKFGLHPVYLCIGDGGEHAIATSVCSDSGISIVTAESIPWREIVPYVSQYRLAVSGRHHLNLFLMLAGVPFVPLPSNTWKIEATLQLLDSPLRSVRSPLQLGSAIKAILENPERFAQAASLAGKRAAREANRYLELLAPPQGRKRLSA